MDQDKIALVLKDLAQARAEMKEIKKTIRGMEKVTTEEYKSMKKHYKEMRMQIKEMEDEWQRELLEDDEYNKMRDLKMEQDEKVAGLNEKLFDLIDGLPPKFFEMNVDLDDGRVRVQVQPEMKMYLNGKEEKRR